MIMSLYDLAINRYVNKTNLSFEEIPELESSRKRGMSPNLCNNKGKFGNTIYFCIIVTIPENFTQKI